MNLITVSTASLSRFQDCTPHRFPTTLAVMRRILQESVVDGFELLYKPEWDGDPALSGRSSTDCTAQEVLSDLLDQRMPILSVHARKDLGTYLCSRHECDLEKGRRLIHNALAFTEALGAGICTFHLWNTFETDFDPASIQGLFNEVAGRFPNLKASVENIPTSLEAKTPLALVKRYKHITMDTRWAARYSELSEFRRVVDRVANVHLRGALEGERWVLDVSGFDFYEALCKITGEWRYRGMLTVEPDGEISSSQFGNFLNAMRSLRRHISSQTKANAKGPVHG